MRTIKALALSGLIGLMGASGATAQETATAEFNLLSFEGTYTARLFTFDEAYTEQYGIEVPLPFAVQVPLRDDIELIADGAPDSGFVKFTFATDLDGVRTFVENFLVVTASVPMMADSEDPTQARMQVAAQALEQQVYPSAVQDFQNPGIVTQRTGLVNGVPAAELVARYLDPAVGPMVLRIIALMHPDRPESYVVLNNINQTLVPISEIAQLPQTLGGIMFQNWVYN